MNLWLRQQLNERKNAMTELEKERLEDFKRILTYRLVTKIKHDFKGKYKLYYEAPCLWAKWKKHDIKYDKAIYKLIIMFNQTSLSAYQVQSIFGKTSDKHWLAYSTIIAQDPDIKVFNKGTICMGKRRFGVKQRYQLPFEFIKSIFEDKKLLEKVVDAGSDYYTPRQRRLIFTQINNIKKNYHYKTRKELVEELTEYEKLKVVLEDLGLDVPTDWSDI